MRRAPVAPALEVRGVSKCQSFHRYLLDFELQHGSGEVFGCDAGHLRRRTLRIRVKTEAMRPRLTLESSGESQA